MPITLEQARQLRGYIHFTLHWKPTTSETFHNIGLQPFDNGRRPGKVCKIVQPLVLNPSSSKQWISSGKLLLHLKKGLWRFLIQVTYQPTDAALQQYSRENWLGNWKQIVRKPPVSIQMIIHCLGSSYRVMRISWAWISYKPPTMRYIIQVHDIRHSEVLQDMWLMFFL